VKAKPPPTVAPVGIVAHPTRPQARDLARALTDDLAARGVAVRVPASDAAELGLSEAAAPDASFADGLRLVVSLGGDGTMLRAVDLVAASGVPVVGVNVGHLGYLTALVPDDLPDVLEDLLADRYLVEERMALRIEVHAADGPSPRTLLALNEAVLEKAEAGNTVHIDVAFNGVPFTTYSADGVIVATPTGSTAYAFSARGPIVSPRMRALVVVPVSAHMLFDRSLVLGADEIVELRVTDERAARLFVDGRDEGLLVDGSALRCLAAPVPVRLVTFEPRDFHQILRTKFGLVSTADHGLGAVSSSSDASDDGNGRAR
jgi:NAD+ kinase